MTEFCICCGASAAEIPAPCMISTYSDLQLEQSRVSQEAANVQAERAMEDPDVGPAGQEMAVKNTGPRMRRRLP